MNVGDAFLMEYPRGGVKHLFFVVAKPQADRVLLVNVTSIIAGIEYDTSCVLRSGDHPFIKHDSFVVYAQTVFAVESYIETQIRQGICRAQQPASSQLLDRISRGAAVSDSIPEKYKKFF